MNTYQVGSMIKQHKNALKIIKILLSNTYKEWKVNEIVEKSGICYVSVLTHLRKLTMEEITICRIKKGKRYYMLKIKNKYDVNEKGNL